MIPWADVRVRAGHLLLSVTAVLGVASIVVVALCLVLDWRPVVVRSGSMEPAVPTGSLAMTVAVDADEVRIGDVVTVPTATTRVTHRVVESVPTSSGVVLTLKGDANDNPDATTYPVDEVHRLWFHVPVLGAVIAWLSVAPGIFVIAGFVALMFTLILRRPEREESGDDEPRAPRRKSTRRTRSEKAGTATALSAALLVAGGIPAWSLWGDSVPIAVSTVSTLEMATPNTPSCSPGVGFFSEDVVNLSWTKANAKYAYEWQLVRSGQVESSGTVGGSAPVGNQVTQQITPSGLTNGTYGFRIRAVIPGSSWASGFSSSTNVTRYWLFLNNMRCG